MCQHRDRVATTSKHTLSITIQHRHTSVILLGYKIKDLVTVNQFCLEFHHCIIKLSWSVHTRTNIFLNIFSWISYYIIFVCCLFAQCIRFRLNKKREKNTSFYFPFDWCGILCPRYHVPRWEIPRVPVAVAHNFNAIIIRSIHT